MSPRVIRARERAGERHYYRREEKGGGKGKEHETKAEQWEGQKKKEEGGKEYEENQAKRVSLRRNCKVTGRNEKIGKKRWKDNVSLYVSRVCVCVYKVGREIYKKVFRSERIPL